MAVTYIQTGSSFVSITHTNIQEIILEVFGNFLIEFRVMLKIKSVGC